MTNYTQWKSLVDLHEYSAIPDSGMDHFYYSQEIGSIDPWPDEVGDLDAASDSNPSLVSDGINGFQSVEYSGGANHQTADPWPIVSDEWTAAGVIEPDTVSGDQVIIWNGDSGGYRIRIISGEFECGHPGVDVATTGSATTDPTVWVATYHDGNVILDANGEEQLNAAIGPPVDPTDNATIATRPDQSTNPYDGLMGAVGAEARSAEASRRDEITNNLADAFNIDVS